MPKHGHLIVICSTEVCQGSDSREFFTVLLTLIQKFQERGKNMACLHHGNLIFLVLSQIFNRVGSNSVDFRIIITQKFQEDINEPILIQHGGMIVSVPCQVFQCPNRSDL
eukprot:Pompholyxophrys_punicea_v1_NODE_308_length_2313_cov_2.608060.p2 type:complete len:110 gc:universal NODE_308_length_2313_cov_2.608060:632-303(-)